jgi:hypothetical protein
MSSVIISGDTSGAITVSAPAVSGTNTATLPAATGELSMLGTTGQTWQNLTASRALSTTYTNTTGKPISVMVDGYSSAGAATGTATVNGAAIQTSSSFSANYRVWTSFIVPPSASYSFSISGTPVFFWSELR